MFNTPPQKYLKQILSCHIRCGRLLLLFYIPAILGLLVNPCEILWVHMPSRTYTPGKTKAVQKLLPRIPGTDLRALVLWGERVPVSPRLAQPMCSGLFSSCEQASLDVMACLLSFLTALLSLYVLDVRLGAVISLAIFWMMWSASPASPLFFHCRIFFARRSHVACHSGK